jgi:hypothetical protein
MLLAGEPIEARGATLRDALAGIRATLPAGRLIVEVRRDDQPLLDDELEAALEAPLAESDDLHLVTTDRDTLALDALDHARARLDFAADRQLAAADQLQQDQPAEAFANLGEAVGAWVQSVQAVLGTANTLELPLDTLALPDGRPIAVVTQQIAQMLKDARQQLEDRDELGLADALAHDWPALTQQWGDVLDAVIEHVESR